MSRTFRVPAQLAGYASKVDGGMSLRFATQELGDGDKVIATKFLGKFGWLVFKENEVEPEDIPRGDAEGKSRTPSERLRAVLWVYWDKVLRKPCRFEEFYANHMELAIGDIKAKLPKDD